ncbi:hypothetical protein BE21_01115 [Sorangium cellulosum]|uniref:Uncharacterized protein n=1 Tax=Sorangium cellulosum TaxID=56 RepID=A0A150U1Z5_SORCE|nr:hypothetical protein BE21_01115 [Sorangium cellulosum]
MAGRARSRGRTALIVAAAAAHLGCVVLGALHVDPQRAGWLGGVIAYHGALSGADSGYNFFAPAVSALPWARFQVTDASGAAHAEVLESGANHEADLRVRSILSLFLQAQDEALRRSLVASWAGKMFARHPGAKSVVVRLEICDLPSMQEYREGRRPAWNLLYQAKLVQQSRGPAARPRSGGAP